MRDLRPILAKPHTPVPATPGNTATQTIPPILSHACLASRGACCLSAALAFLSDLDPPGVHVISLQARMAAEAQSALFITKLCLGYPPCPPHSISGNTRPPPGVVAASRSAAAVPGLLYRSGSEAGAAAASGAHHCTIGNAPTTAQRHCLGCSICDGFTAGDHLLPRSQQARQRQCRVSVCLSMWEVHHTPLCERPTAAAASLLHRRTLLHTLAGSGAAAYLVVAVAACCTLL